MLRGVGYLISITLSLYALSAFSARAEFFSTPVGRLFEVLLALALAYLVSRLFYGAP